jgi:hypothetical protein
MKNFGKKMGRRMMNVLKVEDVKDVVEEKEVERKQDDRDSGEVEFRV